MLAGSLLLLGAASGCSVSRPDGDGTAAIDSLLLEPFASPQIGTLHAADGFRYHLFGGRDAAGAPNSLEMIIVESPEDSLQMVMTFGDRSVKYEDPLGNWVTLHADANGQLDVVEVFDAENGLIHMEEVGTGKLVSSRAGSAGDPSWAGPTTTRTAAVNVPPRKLFIECESGVVLGPPAVGSLLLDFDFYNGSYERPVTYRGHAVWNATYGRFEFTLPSRYSVLEGEACADLDAWEAVIASYPIAALGLGLAAAAQAPVVVAIVAVVGVWTTADTLFNILQMIEGAPCRVTRERYFEANDIEQIDIRLRGTVNGRPLRALFRDVDLVDDGTVLRLVVPFREGRPDILLSYGVTPQRSLRWTTLSSCYGSDDFLVLSVHGVGRPQGSPRDTVIGVSIGNGGWTDFNALALLPCFAYEVGIYRENNGIHGYPPLEFTVDTKVNPLYTDAFLSWGAAGDESVQLFGEYWFDPLLESRLTAATAGARRPGYAGNGWHQIYFVHEGAARGEVHCEGDFSLRMSTAGYQEFGWPGCNGTRIHTVPGTLEWTLTVIPSDLDHCVITAAFTPDLSSADCEVGDDCTESACDHIGSGQLFRLEVPVEELIYRVGNVH